ncbi:MAG: hypothetical protein BWY66_01852 [bacterium ADurb.Bin374]|nr:MAG: hypothetical protein BWY66_01852 [bacterium ADurb.Bin374]
MHRKAIDPRPPYDRASQSGYPGESMKARKKSPAIRRW